MNKKNGGFYIRFFAVYKALEIERGLNY